MACNMPLVHNILFSTFKYIELSSTADSDVAYGMQYAFST